MSARRSLSSRLRRSLASYPDNFSPYKRKGTLRRPTTEIHPCGHRSSVLAPLLGCTGCSVKDLEANAAFVATR